MTIIVHDTSLQAMFNYLRTCSTEITNVPFTESDERAFRIALREYFNALPHHGITSKGDEAKIVRLSESAVYRCTVSTFSESRWVERCLVPYKGWKIPKLCRTESNTSPWTFNWTPTQSPSKEIEKKIIADSQEVQNCSSCDAKGSLNCTNCSSVGTLPCEKCNSIGVVGCPNCSGTGNVRRQKQVQQFRDCTACTATAIGNLVAIFDNNPYTRVQRCATCQGTGKERYLQLVNYEESCPTCKQKGKVRCGTCNGQRSLKCKSCDGRGCLKCEKCNGLKLVVSYLELRRNFDTERCTELVAGSQSTKQLSKCFKEPLSVGRITHSIWTAPNPASLERTLESFSPTLKGPGKIICDTISRLLAETLVASPHSEHVTAWKVELDVCAANIVTYTIGRRSYDAIWDVTPTSGIGETDDLAKVWPHTSIISLWCRKELKRIQAVAETSSIRDAAIDFKKLEVISNLDAACRIAIDQEKADRDLHGVAQASARVSVSQSQIIMNVTAAILFIGGIALFATVSDKVPAVFCVAVSVITYAFSWRVLRR
jgi:hypothetical protein